MPSLQIQTYGEAVGITPSLSSSECVILCRLLAGDFFKTTDSPKEKERGEE